MTVKEALQVVVRDESLGDWIYQVRERVFGDDPDFEGSSWDHPRVQRFAVAVAVLGKYLDELP